MASLLDYLGLGATAAARQGTARMEGEGIAKAAAERDLLARLQQQRQAQMDARQAQMDDLNRRNIESQMRERESPPVAAPRAPQFVESLGGWVTSPDQPLQPLIGAPQAQEKPYEEREEQGGVAIYENGQFKRWKMTPPRERAPNPMMEVTKEQQRFAREQSLADDFRMEQGVKDASGVAGAVATIRGALSNPTPQGDLAAIYALVKLYDPGSVVREGEISLTQSAASLPEQVRRLYQGWSTGKKLTPQMRADIASVANSVVAERQTQVDPILARYGQRARQWGADSAAVAPNPLEGARLNVPGATDPDVEALIRRPGQRGPSFPGARP